MAEIYSIYRFTSSSDTIFRFLLVNGTSGRTYRFSNKDENRINYLNHMKKNICDSMKRKFDEHLKSQVPKDVMSMTIQEFIEKYDGNITLFQDSKLGVSTKYLLFKIDYPRKSPPRKLQKSKHLKKLIKLKRMIGGPRLRVADELRYKEQELLLKY
jgi:hypothetical protein